jgi:site-specific DNA-methyltransferase (adenine-specific)
MTTLALFDAPTPPPQVTRGDCIDWLASMEPESVDLVVTDPAYESLEKHRAKGTTTRLKNSDASSNEWFPIFGNDRFPILFQQLFRVLKNGSHCYVICDQETMFVVRNEAPRHGFEWKKFLVWDKVKPGMGYTWRACHEVICFLSKRTRVASKTHTGSGKPPLGCLNDNKTADVLRFEPIEELEERGAIMSHARVTGYPTEKPVPLLEELIRMSSREGDLVIDPFAGSFSTGDAAVRLGRRFAGCDVKESACELGRKRLESVN